MTAVCGCRVVGVVLRLASKASIVGRVTMRLAVDLGRYCVHELLTTKAKASPQGTRVPAHSCDPGQRLPSIMLLGQRVGRVSQCQWR